MKLSFNNVSLNTGLPFFSRVATFRPSVSLVQHNQFHKTILDKMTPHVSVYFFLKNIVSHHGVSLCLGNVAVSFIKSDRIYYLSFLHNCVFVFKDNMTLFKSVHSCWEYLMAKHLSKLFFNISCVPLNKVRSMTLFTAPH